MKSIISTWSPSDIILPNIDADTEYAAFFVTESGSIDGLDIAFEQGDWLTYIKKNGAGNWYKSNGGITVFNTNSAANTPDPGVYTRVRLDNNGNIIFADWLEAVDLPKHQHDISDIGGDFKQKVQQIVGEMMVNQANGSVYLNYDPKTQTVSADINIDDETIKKGQFGELTSNGSGVGTSTKPSSGTVKIEINDITNLGSKLSVLEQNIQKNFLITNGSSGIDAIPTNNGTELKVRVDGTSIVLNEMGELSLGGGFGGVAGGIDVDPKTGIAAHKHNINQINGLEDSLKKLIEENVPKAVSVTSIPIDNSSIIINGNGELSCISTSIANHSHKISDITDLNPAKVTVWASDQNLVGDYSSGYQNLTNRSIGYAVSTLNVATGLIKEELDELYDAFKKLKAPEPTSIEYAATNVTYENERDVYDIGMLGIALQAGTQATFETEPFYPANNGILDVLIDGEEVYSITFDHTTLFYRDDEFRIVKVEDSYASVPIYKGHYQSMIVRYTAKNLPEGYHKLQWKHTYKGITKYSPEVSFLIYQDSSPKVILDNVTKPDNNTWISGVPCYKGDGIFSFTPRINRPCVSNFIPTDLLSYKFNSNQPVNLIPSNIEDGTAFFEPQELTIPNGYTGLGTLTFTAHKCSGAVTETAPYYIPSLMWNDDFGIEQYRVKANGEQDPAFGLAVYNTYNSNGSLPKYELFVKDGYGIFNRNDYSRFNGANYSNHEKDKYGYLWINLRMKAPFMNNLHLKLLKKDGSEFPTYRDGTLEGVKVYATIANNDVPQKWSNGNSPYIGYGTINSANYSGLDLFKSTRSDRYITFGQRPELDEGYLYVKIGTRYDIDLKAVVESMKESIDEWS